MEIHRYYFSVQKRVFDCVLALILLAVLSPLLVLVAATVFLTAGSPVVFRQERTGQYGRTFFLWKFRTMKKNADALKQKYEHLNEAPAPMFKIHNDPRFVGCGKLLAQTGLDELPQLINILKGEMSFVGPRPLPVSEAAGLSESWRVWREQVRPGVFSQWALSETRHQSLQNWRNLEHKTLEEGSVKRDVLYMVSTPLSQIALFLKRATTRVKSA